MDLEVYKEKKALWVGIIKHKYGNMQRWLWFEEEQIPNTKYFIWWVILSK